MISHFDQRLRRTLNPILPAGDPVVHIACVVTSKCPLVKDFYEVQRDMFINSERTKLDSNQGDRAGEQ